MSNSDFYANHKKGKIKLCR